MEILDIKHNFAYEKYCTKMDAKNITALERIKTALRHKQEVKQQIIKEYAAKGRKVDVVFL